MGKLISTVLPESVTPEWLARTYSEYLYACAEDQIDINNAISEACDDDDLESLVLSYRDVWDANIDVINNEISDFAISRNCSKDDIQLRTTKFLEAMEEYVPSSDVITAATNINNAYNSHWDDAEDLISEIITDSINSDTYLFQQTDVASAINTLSEGVASHLSLPSGYVYPLQDGYVDFRALVSKLITAVNSIGDNDEFVLPAVGSQDTSVGNITLLYSNVISEMKDTVSSNIAWAQGFLSCTLPTIADRITNFAESVKTAFSSAYTEAKDTFNNVRAMLASASCDVKNFIEQAEEQLGWKELIESNTVLSTTDVSAYTGASPYAGIDLHTAKGLAVATARTVAAAGVAVWNGIKKIGKKIWGKIRPYVKAITTNPEDLSIIDKDADSYQVENWAYNTKSAFFTMEFAGTTDVRNWINSLDSKLKNKTFAFDNYFSSLIIRFLGVTWDWHNTNITGKFSYEYQFKPKCCDYNTLYNSGIIYRIGSGSYMNYTCNPTTAMNASNMVTALKKFTSSNNYYLDDDAGENNFITGFQAAIVASYSLAFAQLAEFYDQTANWNGWLGNVKHMRDFSHGLNFDFSDSSNWATLLTRYGFRTDSSGHYTNVTNLDFLKILSGYKGSDTYDVDDGNTYDWTGEFQMFHGVKNQDIGAIITLFASFFILQQNDRRCNPGDFLFLPYTSDTWDFGAPRYAIKTDAQNANIVDIFLSALVAVVVVAVVVIIGAKIARTIKKAKFKKWTKTKGELDNKIWNQKPLSRKEWRKYLRADRKLSKLNLWSAGQATSNVISSIDPQSFLPNLMSESSDTTLLSNEAYSADNLLMLKKLISG